MIKTVKRKLSFFFKNDNKWLLIIVKIKCLFQHIFLRRKFSSFGKNSIIWGPDRMLGRKYIKIGDNVSILHHARMECVSNYGNQTFSPTLSIGNNTSIGQNFHVVAAGELRIGENVTISGDVFITDVSHEYENVGVHILKQPLVQDATVIGDNSFIGYGAVIQAGVIMGKQCIVGSNAVVRKGMYPDYSVIAGVPARVVKRFN